MSPSCRRGRTSCRDARVPDDRWFRSPRRRTPRRPAVRLIFERDGVRDRTPEANCSFSRIVFGRFIADAAPEEVDPVVQPFAGRRANRVPSMKSSPTPTSSVSTRFDQVVAVDAVTRSYVIVRVDRRGTRDRRSRTSRSPGSVRAAGIAAARLRGVAESGRIFARSPAVQRPAARSPRAIRSPGFGCAMMIGNVPRYVTRSRSAAEIGVSPVSWVIWFSPLFGTTGRTRPRRRRGSRRSARRTRLPTDLDRRGLVLGNATAKSGSRRRRRSSPSAGP